MSMPASPRPWRLEDGFACEIVDATGRHVLTATSRYAVPPLGDEREAANAALIVAAVNEREAVRDALRDMEADAEAAWEGTPLRRVLVKHVTALREALAAALDHANECSLRAAAERAVRARAVEEAQRDANMEADRLRDIVRRLLPLASERLATMAAGDCDLLREARAAICEAALSR